MRGNESARAIHAWSKCLTYNPKQYDALYNLGLVAARTGDRARAREALKRFLALAPPAQYGKDFESVRAALNALEGKS
jgi:Tfp pilus assembly protein PilF